MQKPITEKLQSLKNFHRRHNRLPSYSELLNLWKFSSKNAVFRVMDKLVAGGFLKRDKGTKLSPTDAFFSLNLYGEVPAGFPVPTPDENADPLSLEEYLVENPDRTFLLKVSGDSLKDLGIMPKDIVLIERVSEAKSGQVVLAQVDGEWTLKILEKKGRLITLLPANKRYKPIVPKNELNIHGVVKAVIRKY